MSVGEERLLSSACSAEADRHFKAWRTQSANPWNICEEFAALLFQEIIL